MSTDIRKATEIALAQEGEIRTKTLPICVVLVVHSISHLPRSLDLDPYPWHTYAAHNDTRVFKLGINGTVITLRAVSHHAAMYWIEVRVCAFLSLTRMVSWCLTCFINAWLPTIEQGLQQLKAGRSLEIIGDRPTLGMFFIHPIGAVPTASSLLCTNHAYIESEDDIFRQIDQLTYLREWAPPPPNTPFCWLCVPLATAVPPPTNPSCQEVL